MVERKLRERMKIPVFHDDQHGTAIIVGAAMLNALHVVGKKIDEVKLATSGAGAAGIACLDMLVVAGHEAARTSSPSTATACSTPAAPHMDPDKQRYARDTDKRTLADIVDGADIFLGLSAGGVLKPEMVATMAEQADHLRAGQSRIRKSCRTTPRRVRPDCIIATGRSDYPNQVNNALCFPYIFRGALDVGATTINEEMKLACVQARSPSSRAGSLRPRQRLQRRDAAFRPRIPDPAPVRPAPADLAGAGRGRRRRWTPASPRGRSPTSPPIASSSSQFVYRTGLLMKPMFDRARADLKRVVYAEGEEETVLRAVQTVIDEGLAAPDPDRPPERDRDAHQAPGPAHAHRRRFRPDQSRRRPALQRLLAAVPPDHGAPRRLAAGGQEPSCARAARSSPR